MFENDNYKEFSFNKAKGNLLKFFPYIGFQIGKSNLLLEIASIGSIIAVKKGLVFHIIGTLCRQLILYLPVDILHPYPSFFFQSYLLDFLTTICSQIVNLGMKRILKKIVEKSVVPPFYKKNAFQHVLWLQTWNSIREVMKFSSVKIERHLACFNILAFFDIYCS